jgi:hypothetical protein
MALNYFFLVPQIRAEEKYFDVSLQEIVRTVLTPAGKFDRIEEHTSKDEFGIDCRLVLRLNVNCQSKVPEGWTIALKLHNERIDGFDWESEYLAVNGTTGRGWHRHQWSQQGQSAKYTKMPTQDFDGINSREQFLIRALSTMRIRVNARDYGDQLPIPEGDST